MFHYQKLTTESIDPIKIVADSIKTGQPIIFVSINYRLNIFSFGDGKEKNLAVKDQKLGIEWVRKNISAFGGDPVCTTWRGGLSTKANQYPYRTTSHWLERVLGRYILMLI